MKPKSEIRGQKSEEQRCNDPQRAADLLFGQDLVRYKLWVPAINMNHPANTPEPGGRNGTGKSTLRRLPTVGELAAPGAPMPDFVGETEAVTQSHEAQRMIDHPRVKGAIEAAERGELDDEGAPILGKCAQTIVNTLALYGPRERDALAVLSGYSATSGGFGTALADLRELKYIEDGENGIGLTRAGIQATTTSAGLPQGKALLDHWKRQVGACGAAILDVLKKHGALTRSQIANGARNEQGKPYSETSGGFGGALAMLRRLKLIEDTKKGIELCAELR